MADAQERLNDTQRYILQVLRDVIRILDDLNIPYYMQGGTMLGAIRVKGQIGKGCLKPFFVHLSSSMIRLQPSCRSFQVAVKSPVYQGSATS